MTKPPVLPWVVIPRDCACKGWLHKAHKVRLRPPQCIVDPVLPDACFPIAMLNSALMKLTLVCHLNARNTSDCSGDCTNTTPKQSLQTYRVHSKKNTKSIDYRDRSLIHCQLLALLTHADISSLLLFPGLLLSARAGAPLDGHHTGWLCLCTRHVCWQVDVRTQWQLQA